MDPINKRSLSERDICTQFITPAIKEAGWDFETQVREEVSFTKGRIWVRGKLVSRGQTKRADYILYHKPHLPIAIIEAKDNNHGVGAGLQQALAYAEALDIPFAYSSNGDAFLEHDLTVRKGRVERQLNLNSFPSPENLWQRHRKWKGFNQRQEEIISREPYIDSSGKAPRYFQQVAINRVIESITKGQNRILLVMATGTGKTFTAFHIIWRLWKAGVKKRILFLADRNILVDQARTNDFKPFGGAMTKITNRQVDKSYEIYLALYQAVSGTEEEKNIYRQFSRDFFDLVVVDECHRGSAAEDAAWREVLDYFSSATQIGMTATPKETKYISNIDYFGDPVYVYSLRQGIEDGFLAPYKVVRIDFDKDLIGWRPKQGQRDKFGQEIPDRKYGPKDYDRILVLEKRTELVAKKVTEFLRGTNPFDKTIVFCEDIDHAERMRQELVNENADLVAENSKYVMQITGDNPEGKQELDNFIMPESRYPVIVTTSKLLTTGVDAQTCKLIVLDQNINSLSMFKQIIGRGTRVQEDFDKYYFTIMDFRNATHLFADPDFDGPPIQVYEPKTKESPVPPDNGEAPKENADGSKKAEPIIHEHPEKFGRNKYYVNGIEVTVVRQQVQYLGKDGTPITESLWDYSRKNVLRKFRSLDSFLRHWSKADRKKAIIDELEEKGVLLSALADDVGKDLDPFDLICHIAFDQPALTRRERAEGVKKRNYFTKYGETAQRVLDALLDKYADQGIEHIEDINVLRVAPLTHFGTPLEILEKFGGREKYLNAIKDLQRELYKKAA